jgi:uncharacterized protein (TIRG00374 family)
MKKYEKCLIITLLISVLSIALVAGLTFNSETLDALRKIKLEYILAAALAHVLLYLIWGLRIKVLCESLGYAISSLKAIEIVISSSFFAAITPAFAGGELLKLHLLYKNDMPLGRATAVVVGERFLDALIIFSSLPFALFILGNMLPDRRFDVVIMIANLIVLISLFLFIYGVWKPEKVKYLIQEITRKLAPLMGKRTDAALTNLMEKVDMEIDHFHDSVRIYLSEGKKGLLLGVIYTILFWVIDFYLLVLILEGLSQTPSILTVFAAQVIIAVIIIVPATPGASGVAELGAASIFSIFVGSSILGITVIAWRALTYHMNLVVGGFMSLKVLKDMDLIKKLTGDTAIEAQQDI